MLEQIVCSGDIQIFDGINLVVEFIPEVVISDILDGLDVVYEHDSLVVA